MQRRFPPAECCELSLSAHSTGLRRGPAGAGKTFHHEAEPRDERQLFPTSFPGSRLGTQCNAGSRLPSVAS